MADTLPYFIYPANTSEAYSFNSNDQINVSWYWKDPPVGSWIDILLYTANPGKPLALRLNSSNYPTSSYNLQQLSGYSGLTYPATAVFNLSAVFANGSEVNGQNDPSSGIINSALFAVTDNNGQQAQCRNCSFAATTTVSSATSSTTLATSTSAPVSTTTMLTTPTPTPPPGPSGLSGGEIAGIVVGVFAALAVVGAFAWWFGRRSWKHPVRDSLVPQPTGAMSPGPPDEKHGSQHWEPIGIQVENKHASTRSG